MKINIGCGRDKINGFVGLDISANVGADIVHDIENGLPFEDDSVTEIIMYDVLTQLSSKKVFKSVMNELWRVVKKGASVTIRVANAKFPEAFQDPQTSLYFTEDTFTYMQINHERYKKYDYGFKPWFVKRGECPNEKMLVFILNPAK